MFQLNVNPLILIIDIVSLIHIPMQTVFIISISAMSPTMNTANRMNHKQKFGFMTANSETSGVVKSVS